MVKRQKNNSFVNILSVQNSGRKCAILDTKRNLFVHFCSDRITESYKLRNSTQFYMEKCPENIVSMFFFSAYNSIVLNK